MLEEKNAIESDKQKSSRGMSSEKLNLVIALCAIFISAASFYATYLQADAAERQVKAMTLPLIQFSHGNWDEERQSETLQFNLINAGIGPAIIKNVEFKYNNATYSNENSFYLACCLDKDTVDKNTVFAMTNPITNSILAGQSELQFIAIEKAKNDNDFWQRLNNERHSLSLKICYCSMLEECYVTEKNGVVSPIGECPSSTKR